jgi:hypothetical protein
MKRCLRPFRHRTPQTRPFALKAPFPFALKLYRHGSAPRSTIRVKRGWRMVQDFTIFKIGTEIDGGIVDVCPKCRRFGLRQLNRTNGTEGELTFIHCQRIAEDGEFWVFEIIDQHAFKVSLNLPPQDEGAAAGLEILSD